MIFACRFISINGAGELGKVAGSRIWEWDEEKWYLKLGFGRHFSQKGLPNLNWVFGHSIGHEISMTRPSHHPEQVQALCGQFPHQGHLAHNKTY